MVLLNISPLFLISLFWPPKKKVVLGLTGKERRKCSEADLYTFGSLESGFISKIKGSDLIWIQRRVKKVYAIYAQPKTTSSAKIYWF